jgi:hypothetical protein
MNRTLAFSIAIGLLAPLAQGCASRVAPFNDMDQAQITVLRLQGVEQPAPAPVAQPQPAAGLPAIPIPGLTPDQQAQLQAAGQQLMQGVQQAIPGLPNLFPGATQPVQAQPQPELPRFKGFVILAQMPLSDETVKEDLLDLFGNADSFQAGHAPCFTPGMGVAMSRPNAPPVELLISFSCNQAMGDGFQWPHPVNGFTPETSQKLAAMYTKLWGAPVPPSGS